MRKILTGSVGHSSAHRRGPAIGQSRFACSIQLFFHVDIIDIDPFI